MDQGTDCSHNRHEVVGKLTGPSQQVVHDGPCRNNRLIVADKRTGTRFLIDTGADISVLPKRRTDRNYSPATFQLFAANGSIIDTFGEKRMNLNLGLRREFSWIFVIANVAQPIIRADFLRRFGLLVDIKKKRLIDNTTGLYQVCQKTHDNQFTSVSICSNDNPYADILRQFQEITTPNKTTKADETEVMHHIITQGPPVAEPIRWLPPEKYRAAQAEFDGMLASASAPAVRGLHLCT